ncbi:hypothetical protein A464_1213 [Salmonella bongori N268-08]|uniref:Uncharacterized protein n=1 Tax=Salmonella bongori N268-08 TaxID=1197719 RepID=S5MUT5_SALBN|nr:hypothetical protein A464_1213 [Salmonella bongori N268-08]
MEFEAFSSLFPRVTQRLFHHCRKKVTPHKQHFKYHLLVTLCRYFHALKRK